MRASRTAVAAILVFAGLTLSACDWGDSAEPATKAARAAPAFGQRMHLRVLVFNVEYGGTPATDKAIRRVDADVVGVLESYERLPEIAAKTGYPYYNTSLQLLSKYPIHESSDGHGLYALIEVQPGYVIPFFNEHLDYVAWGPRALRRGASVASVIDTENEVRTSALAKPLADMQELIDQGYPVFLTGDFNEPSSLDYTKETVGTREGIDQPVPWPVSKALFDLGFRDSYRKIHRDPLDTPGATWPASSRPRPSGKGAGNRIDYVYTAGPARTLDSEIVGEKGGPDVSIAVLPWTSDHRAVLSTFEVRPVAMPTMVSVDARLRTVGDKISVAYNVPGSDGGEIAIVPDGGDPGSPARRLEAPDDHGSATLDTSGLEPGGYAAVLLDEERTEIARVSFWLRDPQAKIELSTNRRTYAPGEPIDVRWTDGPANRWDWLAVYKASASDPKSDDYLIWAYTALHASGTLPPSTEGSVALGPDTQGAPWPLPPGHYVVHYLLADQYSSAGSARFTVGQR
jgi:endonuclease/exonuclease/phosphatase family metal-dependent hydrolase